VTYVNTALNVARCSLSFIFYQRYTSHDGKMTAGVITRRVITGHREQMHLQLAVISVPTCDTLLTAKPTGDIGYQ